MTLKAAKDVGAMLLLCYAPFHGALPRDFLEFPGGARDNRKQVDARPVRVPQGGCRRSYLPLISICIENVGRGADDKSTPSTVGRAPLYATRSSLGRSAAE